MLFSNPFKTRMPLVREALPGRDMPVWNGAPHAVLGTPTMPPFPAGYAKIVLGLGCFWGAERLFWQLEGVYTTAVGYAGGLTPNPTYEEVCSGQTGHTEAVIVVYDPAVINLETILRVFWEEHDPTQGFRQGNDMGTQYRSAIFYAGTGMLIVSHNLPLPMARHLLTPALALSPPKLVPLIGSSMPKIIISNICTRFQTVIAASKARASAFLTRSQSCRHYCWKHRSQPQ